MASKTKKAAAPVDGAAAAETAKPAETPAAAKKEKAPKKPVRELVTVKAGAMSITVGPVVLAGLDQSYRDEAKAQDILAGVNRKRYDLLSMTTEAIVKAANADDSIDLSAAVSGDTKKMNILNDQLGIALGFREIVEIKGKNGEEPTKKIVVAKAVEKYFPNSKDPKDSPETKRKATLRTNWLHMLKKCAQASIAIIDKGIVVKTDKETGTLRISGPAVSERFGQSEVLLNEKLTIGEGDKKVTLKEKPSFTALAKMGAEAEGKTLETRKDSRVASNAVDAQMALQSLCNTTAQTIGKFKEKPTPETMKQLNALKAAVDKIISDNK